MITPQLFDTIATLQPISLDRLHLSEPEIDRIGQLPIGQVGTIVEIYTTQPEPHYLIEFADPQGRAYALATLQAQDFLLLHYELVAA
ncbi:DUF4926 domain-containing protein [Prochlorothrix hollandica]|uniref:DUF4926 domain-containing protein n=1 Tax=Prochlorothrix hollandica PCC 9006 = CALU 1027 TaxID=317619 RepID=A0A0M2PT00_PROHO|nr:DUF4926 domain-containing protein [Prochlorothrix hollandica]KKI98297.1 hypothetical protein PROH_19135 [Prochlorothrix hollandica PCC 9006 = CALU 1027]